LRKEAMKMPGDEVTKEMMVAGLKEMPFMYF
jgi:hypothetical protein